MTYDKQFYEAALVGYEHQLYEVNGKIAEIQAAQIALAMEDSRRRSVAGYGERLGTVGVGEASTLHLLAVSPPPKRRTMSPEARARIGAAARKRWREYRKRQAV